MIDRLKDRALVAKLASIAAALILGTAYVFQFGFGYQPCALCYNQRYPYMVIIGLAVVASLLGWFQKAWYLAAQAALFATVSGYALYHVGVEQKWWAGPSSCTGGGTFEVPAGGFDLTAAMSETKIVMCDEVAWELLGISMAGYNFILSFGLMLLCLFALWKGKS